jgi:uncharacterized protein with WD repeat
VFLETVKKKRSANTYRERSSVALLCSVFRTIEHKKSSTDKSEELEYFEPAHAEVQENFASDLSTPFPGWN